MIYAEERDFTLRFALRCEFPDDYEGEEDGGKWAEAWDAIAAEVVAAAIDLVRRRPGWTVRPANRGRPVTEEVTLKIERVLDRDVR
ncbi:MAG TPA: hypothetical protein VMU50_22815 [Polyangia bacterium]|nr:hypothetical protein [Polyangia bacterium]